ncbi:MAG: DUF296 domain-containing protein [Alphaproteobacteria bacterium]|nr:DUF296 domain-containing protein [Alphaproteobacteria bacterium]
MSGPNTVLKFINDNEADRRLIHPGPINPTRIVSADGNLVSFDFTLQPGVTLINAIADAMKQAGVSGGAVILKDLVLSPIQYVMPAFSKTPDHVAYYSETYKPDHPIKINFANATVGDKDGAPFLHCHALWRSEDGKQKGGHILPHETFIAEKAQAHFYGTKNIAVTVGYDPETNFSLFEPKLTYSEDSAPKEAKCVVARIRPNEDLIEGIEACCKQHGISKGKIRSGVGSIVGALFENGIVVEDVPTEIVLLDGDISTNTDGTLRADIEIGLIDAVGDIHSGTPVRGRNPVLISFEMVIEGTS